VDYFDPYFLDSPVSLGLGFWDTDRDLLNTGFREHSTGGSVEFGRRFLEYWRITLGYRYQLDDVDPTIDTDGDGTIDNDDLPTGVSGEKLATSSPSLSLSYDTRDNIFDPMRGWSHRIFAQVAGGPLRGLDLLGGDTQYYKLLYDVSFFQPSPRVPVMPEPTLALHTRVGRVWGFGDNRGQFGEGVPIFERFFLGGTDSIRGYEERLLGPRDPITGQPSGGLAMWQFNAELKWPLVRRVLTLALPFYDIGNSWANFPPFDEIDSGANPLAESLGVGIRLTVPGTIILIRVDYGWGRTDLYDPPPNGKLHFNIGNIF
jgi:outer membrane protein insertion porin family